MNMHRIFKTFILPKLLMIAEQLDAIDSILSISLYGSANYKSYEGKLEPRNSALGKRDYDTWIVFRRGCLTEIKKFATGLFGTNFSLLPNQPEYILYGKIHLQTSLGKFLVTPMIVTEESYGLVQENLLTPDKNILVPWYRPRARERSPKVPICFTNFIWSEFDMQQTYLQFYILNHHKEKVTPPYQNKHFLSFL